MNDYQLIKIKQKFKNNSLTDLKSEMDRELGKFLPLLRPGARIAIAVGSRGIRNLALVVKEVADFIMKNNAFPFIIPAMGSHGGATADGQMEILASYGISEETMGIPVLSSMDVVELQQGDFPVPLFMDKYAFEADGIILINRIKPHTDYHNTYESGLVKMAVIGLGKERQASVIHRYGIYGLSVLIPFAAEKILSTGKILGGIGLVENAFDDTMLVKALKANEILDSEPRLLEIARENMPFLPVEDVDLLIIDQMGKDISGVGIDPNIIGRIRIEGQEEPIRPKIRAIILLDLTDNSHGNAIGIGLSDVISRRLYNKIDFPATYTNVVTSSFLERAKVPIVAESDKEAFELALRSCGYIKEGEAKVIRIKDTLHLDEIYISRAISDRLKGSAGIETISEYVNLFDSNDQVSRF